MHVHVVTHTLTHDPITPNEEVGEGGGSWYFWEVEIEAEKKLKIRFFPS